MRIFVKTYGCTLNQADSEFIKGILRDKHTLVNSEEEADLIIFNTCTVKAATENKIFSKMKKTNKPFVIAGCLWVNADRIKREISNPVVVSPLSLSNILEAVDVAANRKEAWFLSPSDKRNLIKRELTAPILPVSIQEGCTGNCFFCQTKLARPKLISYPPKSIKLWVEEGIKKGAKEIRITGMDTGAYGLDIGSNLPSLMKEILNIDGDFMVRLGMLNPQYGKKYIKEIKEWLMHPKFFKFLHLPVQTGSEDVCIDMNRPHKVDDFISVAKELREEFPDLTLSTDIIVGYPTETEKDFQKTLSLVKELELDVVNLSKYTPREGTRAKEMKQLPTEIIKKRSVKAAQFFHSVILRRNQRYIGKKMNVLILEKIKGYVGRTKNYKQVLVGNGRLGEWKSVVIQSADHSTLYP